MADAELRVAASGLLDDTSAERANAAAKQLSTLPALRACLPVGAKDLRVRVVVEKDVIAWARVETIDVADQARCVEVSLVGAGFAVGASGRTFLRLDLDAPEPPGLGRGRLGERRTAVPVVIRGTAQPTGDLDKSIIRRYIRPRAQEVAACALRAQRAAADMRIETKFLIGSDGRVMSARVDPSTGDANVDACITRAMQRWQFPPTSGGGIVSVVFPFEIKSPEPTEDIAKPSAMFRASFLPAAFEGTLTAVAEAADGRLLLGTAGLGVHYYDGRTLSPARLPLAGATVRSIVRLRDAGYGVLTDRGTVLVRGTSAEVITPLATAAALQTADGKIFLGTERGLQVFEQGRVAPVPGFDPTWSIDSIRTDGDRIVVTSRDKRQRAGDDAMVTEARLPEVVDARGDTWTWSDTKLELVDGVTDASTTIDASHGLAGQQIRDVIATRDGGVIAITDAGLFQRVTPRLRNVRSPLYGRYIYQVLRGPAARLLVSEHPEMQLTHAPDGMMYRSDGTKLWRVDRPEAPLFALETPIRAVVVAADGTIHLATDGGLLAGRPGARPAIRIAATETGAITTLLGVGDDLWVGAEKGLWRISAAGVARVRDERVHQLAAGAGLVAAGTSSGLLVLDSGTWLLTKSEHGLLGDEVRAVAVHDDGTVVAATAGGLNILRRGRLPVQTLTRADGMPAAQVASLYSDPDGTLWIGTIGAGLYELAQLDQPPGIAITGVRVDGRMRPLAPVLDIAWSADLLSVQTATATWVDRPDNVIVEVEVVRDGEVVARRSGDLELPISELGTGVVELRITARGVDGVPSPPALLTLHVEAPPWKRPGLVLLFLGVVALVGGGVFAGPRLRHRLLPWLALRTARKKIAAEPASAVDVALELYRRLPDPAPVLRALAARTPVADASATLRIFELLGRDPEAGLRMARSRRDAAGEGWLGVLGYLGQIATTHDLATAATIDAPKTQLFELPALRGLVEVIGVVRQYGQEPSAGKRWDYLRGAHEYLATLLERAREEVPVPIAQATALVATELRRRIALEMRAQDWRTDELRPQDGDSLDSRKLRFVVENEFPRPIAHAFSRVWRETEPASQAPVLGSLLELLLAYVAGVLVTDASGAGIAEVRQEARKRLVGSAPSAGDWLGLARGAATGLRERGRAGPGGVATVMSGPMLEALDDAVAQRNRLVHRHVGITRDDTEKLMARLTSVLGSLGALREAKLVVLLQREETANIRRHRGRLLHGFQDASEEVVVEANVDLPLNVPVIIVCADRRVLDLRPLAIHAPCEQCSGRHLFWFSRLTGKAVEYVSAEGHTRRDREAPALLETWLSGEGPARSIECDVLAADFDLVETRRRLPPGYVLKHEAGIEIEAHVGQGGFADVYRSHRVDDRRLVAVKVLPYQYLRDSTLVRRFRQEAAAARRFEHPNVVRVLGFGEDAGDYFLVMELATGWTGDDGARQLDLRAITKPIAPALAVDIARQTLAGLAYVHGEGIVHRDVKPANLLLFDGGVVKLADFGTARTHESLHLTRTGLLAATPEYMSPEQADGSDVNLKSDLYSLGVVMYELLSGQLPFKGDTPLALALARIRGEPPSLAKLAPEVPRPLCTWVHRLLARDPAKRPSDATEAATALEALLATKVA